MQGTEKMCYYGSVFGWYGWKAIGEFSGEAGGNRQVGTLWERVRFWVSLLLSVASEFKNSLFETSFCDWSAAVFQIIDVCCFSKYALQYIAS